MRAFGDACRAIELQLEELQARPVPTPVEVDQVAVAIAGLEGIASKG